MLHSVKVPKSELTKITRPTVYFSGKYRVFQKELYNFESL